MAGWPFQMCPLIIFFFAFTFASAFNPNFERTLRGPVKSFPFLQYFNKVRSVLFVDLDGVHTKYADRFIESLMTHGKTPCIVRQVPEEIDQGPNDGQTTVVKMIRTYLINRGRNTGSFIFMSSPKVDQLMSDAFRSALIPLARNPTVFVFYGMNKTYSTVVDDIRPQLEHFFERVWSVLKIPGAMGVILTPTGKPILCTYDTDRWAKGTYGRGIRFFSEEDVVKNETIWINFNLHKHYPLRISFFKRYPTTLKIPDPQPELFKRLAKDSWGYGGIDGFMMGDAVRALQMNASLRDLGSDEPFGYILRNGTIAGSLGDIVHMRADISFNSRFVKAYGIESRYEYSAYIHTDNLCLVVPKAGPIPLWQNVCRVFSGFVWSLLLLQTVSISVLRWLQLRLRASRRRLRSTRRRVGSRSLLRVALETHAVIIVPVDGVNRAPARERLLLSLCLLINLILVSTFEGNLHAAFNKQAWYKDIDTMEELDKCGLEVSVSQGFTDLFDVFEDSNSPAYVRLNSKIHVESHASNLIDAISKGAPVATLARQSDIKLAIKTQYVGPAGLPLLHVVGECPRGYTLSYITSKNFPFQRRMHAVLQRLTEAGLPRWYYDMTASVVTTQERRRAGGQGRAAPLRLPHVAAAFVALGGGLTLAVTCLVVEIAVDAVERRRRIA